MVRVHYNAADKKILFLLFSLTYFKIMTLYPEFLYTLKKI